MQSLDSGVATGVHCADAIFHLPELCTNTTVVPSCELSLADLVRRMPVRIAVSPNRRTDKAPGAKSWRERCMRTTSGVQYGQLEVKTEIPGLRTGSRRFENIRVPFETQLTADRPYGYTLHRGDHCHEIPSWMSYARGGAHRACCDGRNCVRAGPIPHSHQI